MKGKFTEKSLLFNRGARRWRSFHGRWLLSSWDEPRQDVAADNFKQDSPVTAEAYCRIFAVRTEIFAIWQK